MATVSALFPCVDVEVLDVGGGDNVECVTEVAVEVGAVEVELTELGLNVDKTDEVAGPDTDEAGDELG